MAEEKLNTLEELYRRKAELKAKCQAKGEEINAQVDYITGHIGEITIKSIIGDRFKKGKERKTEIIEMLVAEGIEIATNIQRDPHDIKDKLFTGIKKAASGVMSLFFR